MSQASGGEADGATGGRTDAQASVVIARPVDDVFAFASDSLISERGRSNVFPFPNRDGPVHVRVTAVTPPHTLAVTGRSRGIRVDIQFLFEPVTAGTRVTERISIHGNRLVRLFTPFIARGTRGQLQETLEQFRSQLEAEDA